MLLNASCVTILGAMTTANEHSHSEVDQPEQGRRDVRDCEPDQPEPSNGGASPDEHWELPEVASSRIRATAAWWFVFLGPVFVATAALVAGIAGDSSDVQLTFALAVFVVVYGVGLVASPRQSPYWYAIAVAVALVAAFAAAALVYFTQVTVAVAEVVTTTSTKGVP